MNLATKVPTVFDCLMECSAKDTLISLKPFAFEKRRMDLVLSFSKWIDSLLSMNHSPSDANYLFK